MFAQTILDFADYLNEAGYAITPDKITQCVSSFTDDDADCTSYDDIISSTRFYFCKDRIQRLDLPQHFMDFVKQKQKIQDARHSKERIAETEKELENQKDVHKKRQDELSDSIESLQREEDAIKEQVLREWEPDPAKFAKSDLNFLVKKKDWISSLDMPTVESMLSGKGVSEEESRDAQKRVMKMAEESLANGNAAAMKDLKKLFDILKKVNTAKKNEAPMLQKAVEDATKETHQRILDLKKEKQKEEQEHQRIQNMLNSRINELRFSSLIVKPRAIIHREEFSGGRNAVQTTSHINCPPEAEKEFKKLTQQEKQLIYKYIHENILKFKTRLTRNILDLTTGRIDMGRTIKNACRTGGLPFDIYKEIKKPGKTNLILMLDVSGSCKEASEMMITFMYMLQEVFPRGCQAYAFVNSLYDITDIMSAKNAEEAIKETLTLIPRSGQYSNYEKPICTMWNGNRSKITKDSIVVIIGDARNNKNGPAENEFKNIVRRAKKTYWLNTDHIEKWGQGDSIAPTYAKYCRMFETRTPKAIVQFLDQGMR